MTRRAFAALPFCVAAAAYGQNLSELLRGNRFRGDHLGAIGVTRKGTAIPALFSAGDFDYQSDKTRVLLVGGLSGSADDAEELVGAWKQFHEGGLSRTHTLCVVPLLRPDGPPASPEANRFPPDPDAYRSEIDPEAQYLWRWIGTHAPDLVIEVGSSGLASGLRESSPVGMGQVAALSVPTQYDGSFSLGEAIGASRNIPRPEHPARQEVRRRLGREPIDVSRKLAAVYGHEMENVAYQPALALIGRMRLGELDGDDRPLSDVEQMVLPFVDGTRPTLADEPSAGQIAGHLVFSDLARRSQDGRYRERALRAASFGFNADGSFKESMPPVNEMSDAVFMGCPILAEVGRLTGERKYFEMARRHLRFMLRLDVREGGLYRHSPLNEAAWGRGNGFPALGLAWTLSATPKDESLHREALAALRSHLLALLPHQDPTGAWRQVIDRPESYREFTVTAMIAFAMLRALRRGWVEPRTYGPAAERAWRAVNLRVGDDGSLIDVCTGTGKQRTLRDYYDRKAILGLDERGGAMALLAATEAAFRRREQ